jgi:hypothetical protein
MLALQTPHLRQQSTVLHAKPRGLSAGAGELLGKDRHNRAQAVQTIEQVLAISLVFDLR